MKYLFVLLVILTCTGTALLPSFYLPNTYHALSVMGKITSSTISQQHSASQYDFQYYWFHVGAEPSPSPSKPTGAEVDIQITPQSKPKAAYSLSYWIGMETDNDAFIQVGYLGYYDKYPDRQMPFWFWEYFPAGKADSVTYGFTGGVGDPLSVGSWVHFRLQASDDPQFPNRWYTYVNDKQVGFADLSISYGSRLYAAAEIGGTTATDDSSANVFFRNLGYRDSSGTWHLVERGRAISTGFYIYGYDLLCYYITDCYGADKYYGTMPNGLVSTYATNNNWTAGSNLPQGTDKAMMWPWYHVTVTSPSTKSDHYYITDSSLWLKANQFENATSTIRQRFAGWSVNGVIDHSVTSVISVQKDMEIKSVYVTQYYVNVTSPLGKTTGSGWYDTGSNATIKVTPFSIPINDTWGRMFSMRQVFSGWSGDFNGLAVNGTSKVHVTSPVHIIAGWRTDYGTLPYVVVLLLAVATSTVLGFAYYSNKLRIPGLRNSKGKRTRSRIRHTSVVSEPEAEPQAPSEGALPTESLRLPDTEKTMMFCNQCGARISRNSKFCKECGTKPG